MGTKYFIGIKPGLNESHPVHKEDCPFMPDEGMRIPLGTFKSSYEAFEEGRKYFPGPCSCRFCLKEHREKNIRALPGFHADLNFITSDLVTATCESPFLCSVN
jgi:hypothetical protein